MLCGEQVQAATRAARSPKSAATSLPTLPHRAVRAARRFHGRDERSDEQDEHRDADLGRQYPPRSAAMRLLVVSTASVAIPRPRPLPSEVLTASSGQRPSNCTSPGFWSCRPVRTMSKALLMATRL